ncbi:hypothetical protein HRJ34_11170 [Rhizorhabdus wittichii]|uniref:PqqD family peptide modification chaperone n=1 Tax=Rhizorhabdus wittichii TaxID=160791 RepID=A0A975HHM0_9SPHN|nr:hypothetical protein [Rhizorhabdus wittichii]QTH24014.1 hypothetical protein HRJ34_11170 [Rhizorhabdus wittichii]
MVSQRFGWYEIDDALIVVDAASGEALFLNQSASILWLALTEAPCSEAELADILAGYFPDLPSGQATGITALLGDWEAKGLCRQGASGRWEVNGDPSAGADDARSDKATADWRGGGAQLVWSRGIRLHVETVAVEIWVTPDHASREGVERLQGFLGGLPQAEGPGQSRLAIWIDGPQCHLLLDGVHRTTQGLSDATGFLFQALVNHAYPECRNPITLHAGAIGNAGGTIIMPAISGSGKTTLTAYLAAQGWRYGGDDIIGLARAETPDAGLLLLPLPSALGIKTGSWALLAPHFPALRDLPEVRYEGKQVRYLPVPASHHIGPEHQGRRPIALVFPRYVAGSACSLRGISEGEALRSILESGSGASASPDLDGFATLIALIRSVPRYRLEYDRLDDAVRELAQLA